MEHQPLPWTQAPPPAWPVVDQWTPTGLGAMATIRRQLRQQLFAVGNQVPFDTVDDAVLVVDELLSNALRHAAHPVVLQLRCAPPTWGVVVVDHAPGLPPAPTADRDPSLGGMGLGMVARVASATGWHCTTEEKVVWALITPSNP